VKRSLTYCIIVMVALSLAACAVPSLPTATEIPTLPAPTETMRPTEAVVPTDTPDVTEAATPTNAPTAGGESSVVVVVAPALGFDMQVPDGWEQVSEEAFWSPSGDLAEGIGAARRALDPPEEAEAVMLPGPSQVLDSQVVSTPWGEGRRVTLEVYAEAKEGEGQAPVISVETHILVTRSFDGQREALDLFARARDMEGLEALEPALRLALESASWEDDRPLVAWGAMREVKVAALGLRFELPESFQGLPSDLDGQLAFASRDVPNVQVGVLWSDLEPPMEPEAAVLPTPSRVVASEPVELLLGSGRLITLEVLGIADEGEEAPVLAVERHMLLVVTSDEGRRAIDLYLRAPDYKQLEAYAEVLDGMVETAEFVE